jgi:hypothetical protein
VKYIKYFENIDWEDFDWEEESPINYGDGNIHPYMFVKVFDNYVLIIEIIKYMGRKMVYVYPDDIENTPKDTLYSLRKLKILTDNELIGIIRDEIILNNGWGNSDGEYHEFKFSDVYSLLPYSYIKYLNDITGGEVEKSGYLTKESKKIQ